MIFHNSTGIEDEKKNGSDQLNFNGSNNDDLNLPPLETNQPSLNSNGSQTAATTTVLFYQSKDFEETLDADILDYITGKIQDERFISLKKIFSDLFSFEK